MYFKNTKHYLHKHVYRYLDKAIEEIYSCYMTINYMLYCIMHKELNRIKA